MSGLNDEERDQATYAVGDTVMATAVVRLYQSFGNTREWVNSGISGAAVVCTDGTSYFLRIVDLQSNQVAFEQEFYQNFLYAAPRDFFHVFEADEYVAGFSFADVKEAEGFFHSVQSGKKSLNNFRSQSQADISPPSSSNRKLTPSMSSPSLMPRTPPRHSPTDDDSGSQYSSGTTRSSNSYSNGYSNGTMKSMNGGPNKSPNNSNYNGASPVTSLSTSWSSNSPNSSSSSFMNKPPPPANNNFNTFSSSSFNNSFSSSPSSSSPQIYETEKQRKEREKREKKERKEREKRELKLKKEQEKEDSKRKPLSIAGPTNVTHVSHMGWDAKNGFQLRNLPPEWRHLFRDAGIKKSDLQNPETAAFIVQTVNKAIAGGASMPSGPSPFGAQTDMLAQMNASSSRGPSNNNMRQPPPPQNNNNYSNNNNSRANPPPVTKSNGRVPPPPPGAISKGRVPPPPPGGNSFAPPPPPDDGGFDGGFDDSSSAPPPPPPPPGPGMGSSTPRTIKKSTPPPLPKQEESYDNNGYDNGYDNNGYDNNGYDNSDSGAVGGRSLLETLSSAMAQRRIELKEDEEDDEDEWNDEDWN